MQSHPEDFEIAECPREVLDKFANAAEIMDAGEYNFFRGISDINTIFDLYDIQYIFKKRKEDKYV